MSSPNSSTIVGKQLAAGHSQVDIAAADDATAFAVQELLAARWAIAPADRTTRDPGQPGVRLRCFLNLRQAPGSKDQTEGERDLVTG
jgi:hypothetical protein